MRPVDKGVAPGVSYANYRDAAPDLESRIGRYCSYCERYIPTHLAIEHVQPKSLVPGLAMTWSNFLLACVNCNSCKGDLPIALLDYLWPDIDNTLRAYEYGDGGLVTSSPAITHALRVKADASLSLVGLDRYPGASTRPTDNDKRWLKRFETWRKAKDALGRLIMNDTIELREQIIDTALATGLFSIWWAAFATDYNMRARLRTAFQGTCSASFDASGELQARAGGQV